MPHIDVASDTYIIPKGLVLRSNEDARVVMADTSAHFNSSNYFKPYISVIMLYNAVTDATPLPCLRHHAVETTLRPV